MNQLYSSFLSLLIVMFLHTASAAQDSTISLSKFEQFCTENGRLLKTESADIGQLGSLKFEFLRATDVHSQQTATAIRLRNGWRPTSGIIERNWIYIDMEDVSQLLTALDTMKKHLPDVKAATQGEFSIVTSNDIRFSLRYDEGILNAGWLIFITQQFRYLRSDVPWKSFRINTRYLDQLQQVLKTSQTR